MSHLVIMAAGTGGHIMPGLAVAKEMQARGWSVSWLGTSHGMENRLVPPSGIPLDVIRFAGMRGKGFKHTIAGAFRLIRALFSCLRILRARSASVVVGMGGYVCLPGGVVAAILGKPLVLVNADARLLLSNRALSRLAKRVCFGFAGQDTNAVTNARVTGNPVRAEIAALAPPSVRFAGRDGGLRILVVGGSLGAKILNETVPAAIGLMPSAMKHGVMHQCGKNDLATVTAAYESLGIEAQVVPFIEDMASELARADVVVCRSGAITVSELCAAGAASILVPLVVSTTSHQHDNARWLADQGGAIHLPQAQLTPASLASLLDGLTREKLLQIANAARAQAVPNAAASVADEIEKLKK
jgi:UDP-N-acetylglucosamine--N-acetylmuramyl-(pentapeptide) pyrophosphoryl-undecaprenol N-acetylglucosamine transferase